MLWLLRRRRAAWAVLALLLATGLPVFVCRPLWGDVTLYDLAARNLLQGGVHYRDVFDTNLPGIVWLHAGVRGLFGWSSEAIRLVDAAVVSAVVGLLACYLPGLAPVRAARVWVAVVCAAFYLSTTEWCHCQRDTWMLLPALAALYLRRRQLDDLADPGAPPGRLGLRAFAEGLCWGAAFWIKPFVAVPALACWLLSAALRPGPGRRLALDAAGVLGGGLAAGALGAAWLAASGTWPYFWDVMLNWNPEYGRQSVPLGERVLILFTWAPPPSLPAAQRPSAPESFVWDVVQNGNPWALAHLLAVPAAVTAVVRAVRGGAARAAGRPALRRRALLGALYLGWVTQVVVLQRWYQYIQTPAVLLALAVAADWGWAARRSLLPAALFTGLVLAAAGRYHVLEWEGRSLWLRCLMEGSTPELRDDLTWTRYGDTTDWADLAEVARYLRRLPEDVPPLVAVSAAAGLAQPVGRPWNTLGAVAAAERRAKAGLHDGELTCYHNTTHPLHLELKLRPSTRFLHFITVLDGFPGRREEVLRELAASGQRYVVSDLLAVGVQVPSPLTDPLKLPAEFPKGWAKYYPWTQPIVFRSGRYLVHRVTRPVGAIWPAGDGG
jgi:hypothetical protein